MSDAGHIAPPRRLALVVTSALTADHLMRGQARYLGEQGFEVHIVAADAEQLERVSQRERCAVHPVPFRRRMRPAADLWSLFSLIRALRRIRPTVVSSSTPKAGLLGTLASRLFRLAPSVYTFRGLRSETTTGLSRRILENADRRACKWATHVTAVSPSLRARIVERGLCDAARVEVVGDGASNGVDCEHFHPSPDRSRETVRAELGIPANTPVVGFVGRLTRDKGIEDLLHVVRRCSEEAPRVRFLVVGGEEDGDPIGPEASAELKSLPTVRRVGWVGDSARYYRAMDLLAFPSYREGMPNAPLEAAASGLPVVGYRATGTIDAVIDGETGLLAEVGDRDGLAREVLEIVHLPELGRKLGEQARKRVAERFSNQVVWKHWLDFYERILAEPRT